MNTKTDHTIDLEMIRATTWLLELHSWPHLVSSSIMLCGLLLSLLLVAFDQFHLNWLLFISSQVTLGLLQLFLTLRIRFDTRILQHWLQSGLIDDDLNHLDQSLFNLGLRNTSCPHKTLQQRLTACLSLLRKQAMTCVLQVIIIIGFSLMSVTWPQV